METADNSETPGILYQTAVHRIWKTVTLGCFRWLCFPDQWKLGGIQISLLAFSFPSSAPPAIEFSWVKLAIYIYIC